MIRVNGGMEREKPWGGCTSGRTPPKQVSGIAASDEDGDAAFPSLTDLTEKKGEGKPKKKKMERMSPKANEEQKTTSKKKHLENNVGGRREEEFGRES